MNSLEQSWTRLTAAAREAVVGDGVPPASPTWVTRVGALGLAEFRLARTGAGWLAWTAPGFGVAMLVTILAVAVWGPVATQPEERTDLVALADPLEGNSLLP